MTTPEIAANAKLSEKANSLVKEDLSPPRFLDLLESEKLFEDAVSFLAHALPISLAVKWGTVVCRELMKSDVLEKSQESLKAADAWIAAPTDDARWKARQSAEASGMSSAADLVAIAAFLSGGSVTPSGSPAVPPPPNLGNKMAGHSVQVAVLSDKPEQAEARYKKSLELGRGVVKSGT